MIGTKQSLIRAMSQVGRKLLSISVALLATTEYQHRSVVTKLEPLKDYGVTTTDKWPSPLNPFLDRPQVMVVTEYGYTSPTKAEPWNNYGVTNDQWRRPSSPVHDRPQVGLRYSSPPKAEPVNDYGVTNDKWQRPSRPGSQKTSIWHMEKVEPLNNYGVTDDKWRRPSNPVRDGPQVMATEYVYNSPTKVEPLNNYGVTNDKWRRPSRLQFTKGFHLAHGEGRVEQLWSHRRQMEKAFKSGS
ncbi:hypothetical protein LOK49_LG02G01947 [Camellia lanceoleosa]|uniref:Uncharacterized protein n=1 Tax=Camellia lanceoleosa TaxID=1840588 RepID=A0ACC0ITU2_9ERIC|nr:hypothetical protein LOK49_LG02G01947 [Camellia lanceoleosa]